MSFSSTRKSLVVGASGQVGAAIARGLGADGSLAAGRAAEHTAFPEWLTLDLAALPGEAALDAMLAEHAIDAVYCSAGATDVERCESDRAWAVFANHTGPAALAAAAARAGLPFVFFSTDYVFDGDAGPYTEDAEPRPLNTYGQSKLDGERAVAAAHPGALVLRTTTVYGPDAQRKNFLYTLSRVLLAGNTMRVPVDQWANPTYNEDLATAAIELVRGGHNGLFHVAGPDFLARDRFAQLACDLLALPTATLLPIATSDLAQKAQRPLRGGLTSTRLISTLGHSPMRSPAQGIRDWQQAVAADETRPTA